MLLYLDASAFVPLLVDEPSSGLCRRLWGDAEVVASSVLLRVESMAALAQAERMGRLRARQLAGLVRSAEQILGQVALLSVTPELTVTAARLAVGLGLRGYDAVHAASALALVSTPLVGSGTEGGSKDVAAASGDSELLRAWSDLGLTTIDTRA